MRAKKSLGQHFLTSEAALRSILAAADLRKSDTVLEIGPGRGALTHSLLESGVRVIAAEKDRELIPLLSEKFSDALARKQFRLIEGDILELSLEKVVGRKSYKVVANIPYYITGILLRRLFSGDRKPERAVLLLQREVAERIVARNGKESILSLSVKAYGEPRYIKTVPRGSFNPPPQVDSAVLLVENIRNPFKSSAEEASFFELIRAGFSSKRKKLIGNLAKLHGKEDLLNTFDRLRLAESVRAEDVPLAAWKQLSELLGGRSYSQKSKK